MTATDQQTDRVGRLAQLLLSQKHFASLVLLKPEALAIARFLDGVQNDGGRHARAEIPENGQELSRLYTEVSLLREKNRDLEEGLTVARKALEHVGIIASSPGIKLIVQLALAKSSMGRA